MIDTRPFARRSLAARLIGALVAMITAVGVVASIGHGTPSAQAAPVLTATPVGAPAPAVAGALSADGRGGWVVSATGVVTATGDAVVYGPAAALRLKAPIVAMAATPDGRGYWLAASDGGIFTYGDAAFYGSAGLLRLKAPIVAMAATPDGRGYWLAASDGGIFTYGDAAFYGSAGLLRLKAPIVAMAATPDGRGYWLAASDGGIFTYGDAAFYGSAGLLRLKAPIVAMAATPDGRGYWLAASDGGIFTYGDARFYGSGAGSGALIIGLSDTSDGGGYRLIEVTGATEGFGDATALAPPRTSGPVTPAGSQSPPPASVANSTLSCTTGDLSGKTLAVPSQPPAAVVTEYNYEFTSLGQNNNQGVPGRWDPCETVHFTISTQGLAPSEVAARVADVQTAVSLAATSTGLQFVDDGTTASPPVQWGVAGGSSYRGIIFTWVPDLGQDTIGSELGNTTVKAINPGGSYTEQIMSADIEIGTSSGGETVNTPENGSFTAGATNGEGPTLIHELGHALGLQHPSLDANQPGAPPQYQTSSTEVMNEYLRGLTSYQTGDRWGLWQLGLGGGAGRFLD